MKKNILSIFALVAIMLTFSACSENLLEEPQKGVLATDEYYANATDAEAVSLIVPIYRILWTQVWGLSEYEGVHMQDGDHLCGGGSYSDGGANRYPYWDAMTPSTGAHTSMYTYIYQVIYWSNMIVEKLNNEANSQVKSRVIGEAKFLRALALMRAIQYFGNPPFVYETSVTDPANGDPKEMWAWIEQNFNEAAAILPSKADKSGQAAIGGRATKEAALSYLGKAQLLQGKYSDASATLQKVVNSNLYDLFTDFSWVTKSKGDFGVENIFEYNVYDDPTTYSTQNDMRCMYLHVRSSFINVPSDSWGTGWGFCPPSLSFVEFMKEHEAVPGGYSERFNGSIISYTDYQKKPGANGLAVSPWIDNVGYIGLKYNFWAEDYIAGSGSSAPRNARWNKNWVFLRYAEVLLDLAESEAAQNHTDGIGLTSINKIRQRAGLNALSTFTMKDVKDEKRAELWGENGNRFFDLVRWGEAAETLKDVGKYRYEFNAPTRSTETDGDENYPVFSSNDEGKASGRKTYIVKYLDPIYGSTAGYKPGKSEYWPYPESEVLVNPNLKQNPGW